MNIPFLVLVDPETGGEHSYSFVDRHLVCVQEPGEPKSYLSVQLALMSISRKIVEKRFTGRMTDFGAWEKVKNIIKFDVTIDVKDGIANVAECPEEIWVEINDHDNEDEDVE